MLDRLALSVYSSHTMLEQSLFSQEHLPNHFEAEKTKGGVTLKLADGTMANIVKADVSHDDLVYISITLGWLAGNLKVLSTLKRSVSAADAVRRFIREEFKVDAELPIDEMVMHSEKIMPDVIDQIVASLRSLKESGVISLSIQGQSFVSIADELPHYLRMIPPSA